MWKDKYYKHYKIIKKGNIVEIRPLLKEPDAIVFGLGDATISINTNFPPKESIIKSITGESSSRSLLPTAPYDAPKWMQIPSDIKNEVKVLAGGVTIHYKSANLRKFKFVGGDMISSNPLALNFKDGKRINW